MNSKIDLHVHSNFSDGKDSVKKVLDLAKKRNVEMLSFVDHDTNLTYNEALSYAEELGIDLIPGIEISAYDFKRKRKVHILGYNYDLDAPNIKKLTEPLQTRRHQHSLEQIKKIEDYGIDVDLDEVKKTVGPAGVIYKQHIMHAICDEHYTCPKYTTKYRTLFKNSGPASGDIEYIDYVEALKAVRQDNGYAVIAHPGQLHSYELINDNHELIDGIEKYHPDHGLEDYEKVDALCRKYDLFITGGSDYHGDFGTAVDIGLDSELLKETARLFR
jgi:phosphoribosyl 1,2-cyclic phosphate 1,2-diphosphodiesterase